MTIIAEVSQPVDAFHFIGEIKSIICAKRAFNKVAICLDMGLFMNCDGVFSNDVNVLLLPVWF